MEVPSYITTSHVVLLHASFLFNKESCKFIQTFISQKQTPKNIQYLHDYLHVHYIQLPCKVILNIVFSSKCQQSKTPQHVVHSRCDSSGSDVPPVIQIYLNKNSTALKIRFIKHLYMKITVKTLHKWKPVFL